MVLNWRRASDERDLSELQQSQYNYEMLNYLKDELVLWHKDLDDLSTVEVNMYVYFCSMSTSKWWMLL